MTKLYFLGLFLAAVIVALWMYWTLKITYEFFLIERPEIHGSFDYLGSKTVHLYMIQNTPFNQIQQKGCDFEPLH